MDEDVTHLDHVEYVLQARSKEDEEEMRTAQGRRTQLNNFSYKFTAFPRRLLFSNSASSRNDVTTILQEKRRHNGRMDLFVSVAPHRKSAAAVTTQQ